MKLRTINVECLANMHTNTYHFILPNNDFIGFVYELINKNTKIAKVCFQYVVRLAAS